MRVNLGNTGFTLIELLVVIAIIGVLSSVVMASLNSARGKAKDARRASDLRQIQIALELYYDSNGSYPNTNQNWRSQCVAWGSHSAANVIPGLTPTYLSVFPTDPDMNASANDCCYLYISNPSASEYKLMDHSCSKLSYASQPSLVDPARDSGPSCAVVDGSGIWSWAVYTPGVACW